tara:strand:+ start:1573 stop:1836 length:264 start_codon:yes stop_codon:yes gene_type:complete
LNLNNVRHFAEPIQVNVYIIWQENSNEHLLINLGSDPEEFINAADPYRLQPHSIINIYCHLDYVSAISELQLIYAIPFYHHENKKTH